MPLIALTLMPFMLPLRCRRRCYAADAIVYATLPLRLPHAAAFMMSLMPIDYAAFCRRLYADAADTRHAIRHCCRRAAVAADAITAMSLCALSRAI